MGGKGTLSRLTFTLPGTMPWPSFGWIRSDAIAILGFGPRSYGGLRVLSASSEHSCWKRNEYFAH